MEKVVSGKTISEWVKSHPLITQMMACQATSWFNPDVTSLSLALTDVSLGPDDIRDASDRLQRFAPFLQIAFPELEASGGVIESETVEIGTFLADLKTRYGIVDEVGRLFIKKDSHLPISGSVKARGGIYEVLMHAEQLALMHGHLCLSDDYAVLATPPLQNFFSQYSIAVGSTGNLGMSIGIAAAKLGFKAVVHMSSDAREWKKERLRSHGVTVIEYSGDYGEAVKRGRELADQDPSCHFVDDENSTTLFLGYSVAGERLKAQFAQQHILIDKAHPLFVYLPCGVGGGPGGVAFGLKLAFGDNVHCVFAEPTQSPCMLLGVYTGLHDRVSVQDFGIENRTAADGLAVGTPSGFVGKSMQRMIDGYYTIPDQEMFELLAQMHSLEGIDLEPSALAGAAGISRIFRDTAKAYRSRLGLSPAQWRNSTHLVWATGGGMVPQEEFQKYLQQGEALMTLRKTKSE